MKESPILFKSEMIKAILEGRKTQTRRIIKPQPIEIGCSGKPLKDNSTKEYPYRKEEIRCPYGQVGDRLWVRESWMPWHKKDTGYCIKYKADNWMDLWGKRNGIQIYDNKWKPSIHMPRWASRITLEITELRVERLQEIKGEDAIREGVWQGCGIKKGMEFAKFNGRKKTVYYYSKNMFRDLWNSLHKKEHTWEDNPWVWVISFRRVK